ncbi:hypothetical protein [Sulfurimonas sp.]|jgi:hypothetical protein|uniref:hypothetical protein n=1 Tax=Sulfurimonas sp. TaxID=2022749 RepID=UPI0025DA44B5|nr:hypothetical protein [Sulfurimonas sp.]MCK9472968.1 hypothetical protein [Sulfurimonas sp.]
MKLLLLLFPILLIAKTPFDSKVIAFDMSAYETKKNELNESAGKNSKIKCRVVCDKKVYKEQKISDAIKFYKNSKEYDFNKN